MNAETKSSAKNAGLFACGVGVILALGMASTNQIVKFSALRPPVPLSATLPKQTTFSVPLAWNHSPSVSVTGYNFYITSTRTNPVWSLAASVGYTNAATITNIIPPVWFACRAVDADGNESPDSNILGVMGADKILSVWSEVSSNLTGWSYLAPVITKTNPVGAEYFRTVANLTNRWKTETF